MAQFDVRALSVEAMQFDGSPASALEIVSWAKTVAPGLVVRERIEYRGWDDTEGHLELEVAHMEQQAMAGDWIMLMDMRFGPRACILTDREFQRYFTPGRTRQPQPNE